MLHDHPDDANRKPTLALTRADLIAARRLLSTMLGVERELVEIELRPQPIITKNVDYTTLVARAREEFENRRRRRAIFGESMFGEAAWDMLLALYIVDVLGHRLTLQELKRNAGVPPTTATRWIDFLCVRGFISKEPHPTDLRIHFVRLTSRAREKLHQYYSETIVTDS